MNFQSAIMIYRLKYEMNNELEKKNEVIKKKHQEIETLQRY